MTTKKNLNKQLRMDEALLSRVQAIVARSGLAEADILRLSLAAGLDQIESGAYNPLKVAEAPPTYQKKENKP